MLKKAISIITISTLFLMSVTFAFGKPKGTWNDVKNLVGKEIAIKTRASRKKIYGVLKSANDKELTVQTAGKKSMNKDVATIKRDEVKKVWRALLFVGSRKTAKGALIGAAAGAAVLGGVAAGQNSGESGEDLPFTIGFAIIGAGLGAGLGAITGFFVKSHHKKRDLIYKSK